MLASLPCAACTVRDAVQVNSLLVSLCQETRAYCQHVGGAHSMYNACRGVRVLSDIVADLGRPVRLRYCSHADDLEREEDLACCLEMQEALVLIKAMRAMQLSGTLCSAMHTLRFSLLILGSWCNNQLGLCTMMPIMCVTCMQMLCPLCDTEL